MILKIIFKFFKELVEFEMLFTFFKKLFEFFIFYLNSKVYLI